MLNALFERSIVCVAQDAAKRRRTEGSDRCLGDVTMDVTLPEAPGPPRGSRYVWRPTGGILKALNIALVLSPKPLIFSCPMYDRVQYTFIINFLARQNHHTMNIGPLVLLQP